MTGLLATEIQQRKPFAGLEVEAFLNLQRTADILRRGVVELLRPYEISLTGYNVLRILRGAGADGLPCHDVAVRLVAHDPDITRLADRLAEAGLIARERRSADRRVVVLRITTAGLELLAQLDDAITSLHCRQLGHLDPDEHTTLISLLERIRTTKETA